MLVKARVSRRLVIEKLNGLLLTDTAKLSHVSVEATQFCTTLGFNGRTITITGNLTMTVGDVAKVVGAPCELFLIMKSGRSIMLGDAERPFYYLFVVSADGMGRDYRHSIRIVSALLEPADLQLVSLCFLRKIAISNVFLNGINLTALPVLKYIRIVNTGLRIIALGNLIYDHVDLSYNHLVNCDAKARVLILRHNRLRVFSVPFHYDCLVLSDNPLRALNSRARCLYLSRTLVSHPIGCDAEKIVAKCVKRVSFAENRQLVSLNIDNCELHKLPANLRHIKRLSARNNRFTRIPEMDALEHADLSNNFLTRIHAPALRTADLRANNFEFFDVESFPFLESVYLVYNPITARIESPGAVGPQSHAHYKSDATTANIPFYKPQHSCTVLPQTVQRYIFSAATDDGPFKLFIIHKTELPESQEDKIKEALVQISDHSEALEWFTLAVEKILGCFCTTEAAVAASFIMVTNRAIILKAHNMSLLYSNYSEIQQIHSSKNIRVFTNAGVWHVLPVTCPINICTNQRCHKIDTTNVSVPQILDFVDHRCPRSFQLSISNYKELLTASEPMAICDLNIPLGVPGRPYHQIVSTASAFPELNLLDGLGFSNIDFGMRFYGDGLRFSPGADHFPILVYLKLHHQSAHNPVIASELVNIMSVLRFLVLVFAGDFIERSHLFCFVGFSTPISAVFWSLCVQRMLKNVNVDVSIGITQDTTFRTAINGLISFGGPTLNKLVRIADLGLGVFISGFVSISHPLVYLINEGEVQLKGFQCKDSLYSVRFK